LAEAKGSSVAFGGPHNYRAGRHPTSVAVADLNGDRKLDLAVANGRSTVTVLLNHGRGRFPAEHAYRVGGDPTSVAIGDVNGDRKPDLAVANSYDSTVSVLLNEGRGRFGSRRDYPTAAGTYGVVISDLNGDRKPDLATSNLGDEEADPPNPTLSVLLGAGDGSFGAHVDYPTPEPGLGIASADFNGDGRADLVVADAPKVSVFLNSADGLQAARNYTAGGNAVAIADMNGDRKPDLVTEGVSVLLNRGDGSFGRRRIYAIGYAQGLAVGDVNRDGRPDVVTGEPIAPNQEDCDTGDGIAVDVLPNKGHGKLGRAMEFSTDYSGCDPTPALGDVSGDGLPDIVTANNYSGTVSVLVNAHGRCAVPLMTDYLVSLAAAKRMLQRVGCRLGIVRYAYSKRVPRGFVISERPGWGAVLRKGGRVNLVVSKGPSESASLLRGPCLYWFLAGTRGRRPLRASRVPLSFGRPVSYDSAGSSTLLVGDLNRDGRPDLVTDAGAHLNLGNGHFGDFQEIGDGYITALVDLNGDGAPDLVADDSEESKVAIQLNTGNGTFTARVAYRVGLAPTDVAIGDLNGDGAADLATANRGGNTASVLVNRGDGSFLPYVDYTVSRSPRSIAIRDLDDSGRADLVVANVSSNTISVLLNRGDATFQAKRDYATGQKPSLASIADLNADGHPDLVTGNKNNTVSVLLNRGDGTFQPEGVTRQAGIRRSWPAI
jgi:FG-GAP-like repeat/PASTA domain/FG-GAP repeat